MVNTRSSHLPQPNPLQPPPSAPGVSNNPELADFLKSMAESMEVLRKQNEELNARLTAVEARSSEKERERAKRRKKDRRDKLHHGKRHVNPYQEDNESTV
jgi:septal ring factor EnvC (AmiA/AmiB activator)